MKHALGAGAALMATHELDEEIRAAQLLDAQEKAGQLFEAVGRAGILQAGTSDSDRPLDS
jgi:hypothetical protein